MPNKYYKELNEVNAPRGITSPLTGPMFGRRDFFKLAGTGVTGFFLSSTLKQDAMAATAAAPFC